MTAEQEPRDEASKKPDGLEYEAFEKLAKDLLTVGKKQLDEARAREQARKD
jgi:hypothetical protein